MARKMDQAFFGPRPSAPGGRLVLHKRLRVEPVRAPWPAHRLPPRALVASTAAVVLGVQRFSSSSGPGAFPLRGSWRTRRTGSRLDQGCAPADLASEAISLIRRTVEVISSANSLRSLHSSGVVESSKPR